jgi:hypothetical protein
MGFNTKFPAADAFYNKLDEKTISYFGDESVMSFVLISEGLLKDFRQETLTNLIGLNNDQSIKYFEALREPIVELSKYLYRWPSDVEKYLKQYEITEEALLNHDLPRNELYLILCSSKKDLKDRYGRNSLEFDEAIHAVMIFGNYFAAKTLRSTEGFISERDGNELPERALSTNVGKSDIKPKVTQSFSFGVSDKAIPELKEIYWNLKMDTGNFINKDMTTEDQFVSILTSENALDVNGAVHFECETTQVAYILEKILVLYPTFSFAMIEKSKKFITKKGTVLRAGHISKSKSGNEPKQYAAINKFFNKLSKKE